MVTYFKDASETKQPHFVSVSDSLMRIKTGKVKSQVEQIRSEPDEKKRRELKKKLLPCILFSGTFSDRKDESIKVHSGLAVIDFDHVNVEDVKSKLKVLPYVYSYFTSPSGDGVKALIKIPADKSTHRKYYLAAVNELKKIAPIDTTSQNEARVCFESYDPDLYINPHPSEYFIKPEATKKTPLQIAVGKINAAPDGQKHIELLKASRLIGGYIASGVVDEDKAIEVLQDTIKERNIDDFHSAQKTILDGIADGKRYPIENTNRVKINLYDDDFSFVSTRENEKEYLHQVRTNTLPQGLSTGYQELDQYFRFKPGNFVIVNGHDNVGKSTWLWWMSVKSCVLHGWKWIMWCAENSVMQVRKNIIQFFAGKSIHHLTDDEFIKATDWAYEHFTLLSTNELYTAGDIMMMGEKILSRKKHHALLIDPYNALSVPGLGGKVNSHEYDYMVTNQLRSFCRKHTLSTWINCHAVTEALRKKYKDGEYKDHLMPPDKADTEGGGKFSNRADDFITLHRLTQHPTEFYITQIHVRKIKETETGGKPTPKDSPVRMQMVKGKFGFFPVTEMIMPEPISSRREKEKLPF